MAKKIFLVGSCQNPADQNTFQNLANVIAQSVVNLGYELIVNYIHSKADSSVVNSQLADKQPPQPNYNTLDEEVLEAIDKMTLNPNQQVKVYFYESENYNTFKPTNFKNIEVERKNVGGSKQKVLMQSIMASDCVLLVGGMATVELAGQLSTLLERKMLPIPYLSNSGAANLWKEYYSKYNSKLASYIDSSMSQFSGDLLDLSQDPGKTIQTDFQTRLSAFVNGPNPFIIQTRKSIKNSWVQLVLIVLTLTTWMLFYLYGSKSTNDICRAALAYSCIPLCVFLGTSLRNGSFDRTRVFLLDLSRSLIVSFGLVLVYLYAGYLSSGKIESITEDDFLRVTINLSILGLFSGFLQNSATTLLTERLKSFANKETEYKGAEEEKE